MNNIILTAYFTTKEDPQRKVFWNPNRYSIISDWYESINKLGLNGIIFHDSLSDDFIQKYQNDNVKFIYWKLGEFSTNDDRFFCFYDHLKANQYDHVLLTDLDDLFVRNPFDIISGDAEMYAGRDMEFFKTDYFNKINKEYFPIDRTRVLANCDAIGGKYENVMKLLNSMIWIFTEYKQHYNINMLVFNHCLYTLFTNVHVGYPLTSHFGMRENTGNHYIRHK